jgi:RNA polymerase-binding protein DksA
MDESQLQQLKQSLFQEREAIDRQLSEYGATVGRDGGSPDLEGFADSGHATAERSEVISMIEELEASRADVDRALARIENGTYGKCERCGQDIPFERLEAIPTASLCVTCKQLVS